jgi:phage tail-like protein
MRHLRPYTGGVFALELDEGNRAVPIGFVTAIDGGHPKSDPVSSLVGHSWLVEKFPGKPKYDDITLTIGMSSSPAMWKWIKASITNRPERRSGAIVVYDMKRRERQRRTFRDALIAEVGFPALDASSKSSATLTVKISPESIEFVEPHHGHAGNPTWGQDELAKQKMWLTSNFRFSLDRFKGDPTLRNAKIEAFTVKQNIITNNIGLRLESQKEVGRLEMPTIQVSFPMADMKLWAEWYKKSIAEGEFPDEMTNGAISYLSSDGDELMRLELSQVGLSALELEKLEAHKEGVAKVKATLTVETLALQGADGTVGR